MADAKAKINNVPGNKVGKVVQSYVLVEATEVNCKKSDDGSTWTIVATIPSKADHAN